MALATTLLHLNFTLTLLLMRISAGICSVYADAEEGRGCDHERDAGGAAGFRRVSGAFAGGSTGQLATGLGKEDCSSAERV